MPKQTWQPDPYRVLDLPHDASTSSIKRRWRELAREHHPDRAFGDVTEAARLTRRMALINTAYELLVDPVRRADYDSSPDGRAARYGAGPTMSADGRVERPVGPPPPPPSPPVTARFDASPVFRPRNSTVSGHRHHPPGHEPLPRHRADGEPLRASTPTGPVERVPGKVSPPPSLREALDAELQFGKFRGYTLGEVAMIEPTYVGWIARTITRDRDLVAMARVVAADLAERGVLHPGDGAAPEARASGWR